jgi:hypothetical protein
MTLIVTATSLNLRSEPSTGGRILRVLSRNAEVREISRRDGWVQVEAGEVGWVSAQHITPANPPAAVATPAPAPAPAAPDAQLRMAALAISRNYIGGREMGQNWGPLVELFLRNAGLKSAAPWCAAFVQWCSDQARDALVAAGHPVTNPLDDVPSKALVRSYVNEAQRRGWIAATPQPGDLFAWVNPDGTGHIGFVERVADGVLHTVEGNTNDAGSREGDGVYRRTRRITSSFVFIRYRA